MKEIRELVEKNGGLLEALHLVQRQAGHVSREGVKQIAALFDLPEARVFETASFYSYLQPQPVGRHVIRVCESAPCHVAGTAQVVQALEKLLGISMGDTTADGRFTLQYTECVGQCQSSPTITVDLNAHTGLTAEKLPEVLAAYQCPEWGQAPPKGVSARVARPGTDFNRHQP